eukprot:16388002-Heterocapsa_arctica.AAC.1
MKGEKTLEGVKLQQDKIVKVLTVAKDEVAAAITAVTSSGKKHPQDQKYQGRTRWGAGRNR